jgi:hypothetical protein
MNMFNPIKITATGKWKLAHIHVDIPYTFEEVLKELGNETWVSPGDLNPLNVDLWQGQRAKCMNPRGKILTQIQSYLCDESTVWSLIHWMYDTIPGFAQDYDWSPQDMFDHCMFHAELTRDAPGFVNVLHTDYRKLVATGMLYLTKQDDSNLSTVFYDTANRGNPVRMTTNWGDGWWHANGNDTWHEGWNHTQSIRYSFLLGLTLNVQPVNRGKLLEQ